MEIRYRARSVMLAAGMLVAAFTRAPAQAMSQEEKNFLAYLALSVTPPGSLPPLLTRSMAGGPRALGGTADRAASGIGALQVAARYGRTRLATDSPGDEARFNSFVGTGLFSAGEAATVTASIGIIDPTCNDPDCEREWVYSVGGDVALGGTTLGTTPTSPRLSVGLSGELGYTKLNEISVVSASAGIPLAIALGSGPLKFVPYLVPGLGFGRTRFEPEDPEGSAARFLLGGGVGLVNLTSLINVSAGFQKVFFSEASISSKTTFGLALTIGR